jgi:hypothetical protein
VTGWVMQTAHPAYAERGVCLAPDPRSVREVGRGATGSPRPRRRREEHAIYARTPRLAEDDPYPPGSIPTLLALLEELTSRGVVYCLWKSNEHLRAALAGSTDLDLLVQREHADSFRAIVSAMGCKPAVAQPYATYPAMEHYLGLDPASGRLFHLHVHYALVLGERYVKNYHLPVERRVFASLRWLQGVPVPSAAVELAILSVRTLLKYRARDAVKDALKIRSPGVPSEVIEEIEWLLGQTSLDQVGGVFVTKIDPIAPETVLEFLDVVLRSPRSAPTLVRLRGEVREALRGSRRRGRVGATLSYARVLWQRRERLRRQPIESGLKPPGGGVGIAIIGADGAGKSSVVATLVDWLGWKIAVRTYYMGSKQPSRTSRALYLAFRAFRRGTRSAERRASTRPFVGALGSTRDALLASHHLWVARDRARRYDAACRDRLAGRVVVFDRFPMETVSDAPEHRLLDGPHIGSALPGPRSKAVRWLRHREESKYDRFRLPDELLVLRVSADVATRRKPDHDREIVARKVRATTELALLACGAGETTVSAIDADLPFETVMRVVKGRVWDVL